MIDICIHFVYNQRMEEKITHIEQGKAWEESDEVVQVEVKRPLNKVIPVRLTADMWEQLRQEAREIGVGPTTPARMWLMERLNAQSQFRTSVREPTDAAYYTDIENDSGRK